MYLFICKHFIQLIFHYTKLDVIPHIYFCKHFILQIFHYTRCFTRLFCEQHFIVLRFYYTIGDGITRFIYLQTILVLMFHYAIVDVLPDDVYVFIYLFCKQHFLVLIFFTILRLMFYQICSFYCKQCFIVLIFPILLQIFCQMFQYYQVCDIIMSFEIVFETNKLVYLRKQSRICPWNNVYLLRLEQNYLNSFFTHWIVASSISD